VITAAVLLLGVCAWYELYPRAGVDPAQGAPEVGVTAAWAQEHLAGVRPAWHKNANVGHAIDTHVLNALPRREPFVFNPGGYATIKLPSGEIRIVSDRCTATLGQVSNIEHDTITLGKAGRSRHRGIKPTVRGTAMNAVDHPHGGGRGKSKGGNHPRSPWNQLAKGKKTRNKKKIWGWTLVQDRRQGQGG
jgi:hypothetical protein